jgi:hypothetical protein
MESQDLAYYCLLNVNNSILSLVRVATACTLFISVLIFGTVPGT